MFLFYGGMKKRNKNTRKFLGKIDNFIDKQERAFEKKHLRAYLNGQERFVVGYSNNQPLYANVKQELIPV